MQWNTYSAHINHHWVAYMQRRPLTDTSELAVFNQWSTDGFYTDIVAEFKRVKLMEEDLNALTYDW